MSGDGVFYVAHKIPEGIGMVVPCNCGHTTMVPSIPRDVTYPFRFTTSLPDFIRCDECNKLLSWTAALDTKFAAPTGHSNATPECIADARHRDRMRYEAYCEANGMTPVPPKEYDDA